MAISIFSLMGSIFVDSTEAEKSISKTEEKSSKLSESFMKGVETAGKWAAGIAAAAASAAVAIGTAAVNTATDVDKAMNDFAASTGTASDELEAYEDAMLNIYNNNFGESFEDIADSMAQIKQIMGDDIGAAELEQMTTSALMLRDTFDFDVTESIRAVNSMMDQFGVTSEEAYNLIAQGAQNGLNQNGDLLDIVNEYSVQFRKLGYNAEDMFNMLSNGAEEGTWSVDKLGDAVKEFAIRAIDGSDSTADAFKSIGVAIGGNDEAISQAQENVNSYQSQVEKLEKQLKYAKIQQSEFTDKTSELTKIKMADNIAEWTEKLKQAKTNLKLSQQSLEDLQNQAASGTQYTDELFARFASGGEEAQTATQEVISALLAMDDKVAQDAAGVALFGTMWEDLGVDAIAALLDTQGEISNTKDALTEIGEIKYDDLGSMIEGLKRNFETLLLPLGNALIPIIMQIVQLIQDNMPIIEELLAQLTPVITDLFGQLLPPLMDLVSSMLPPLMDIVQSILPMFTELLTALIPIITQIIEAVLPVLLELIETLLPPILKVVDMILPILSELLPPILALLQPIIDLLQPIIDLAMNLITPLMELLEAVLPPLTDVISFLAETVLARLQGAFKTVSNVVKVLADYVKGQIEIIKKVFTGIIDFIKNVFTGNWKAAFGNLKDIVSNIFEAMVNAVKTPINVIIGIINGMISGVTSGINAVIDALNKIHIDVPDWITSLTGLTTFGFNLSTVTAPQIPYLAEGGTAIEDGKAVVGESGAELIDLPQGAKVTPLTDNGDPIGYKALADKVDVMISLLAAILEKEGVINIGETQFINYINKKLGALI